MFGDDEPVFVLEDRSNVISTTTNKQNNKNKWSCDYSSEDIENIMNDSMELDQISNDL